MDYPVIAKPTVSAILAVYNAAPYIRDAIESVLKQTFADFELIIIDDGSTDNTLDLVHSISDDRIRVESVSHRGVAAARNVGLSQARGDLVAVVDADDLNLEVRFEKQVNYLRKHRDLSLVGTNIQLFRDWGRRKRDLLIQFPVIENPWEIRWSLYFGNCIGHATAMGFRDFFNSVGGYREDLAVGIDYDLWLRANPDHLMGNLQERLVWVRVLAEGRSRQDPALRERTVQHSLARALERFFPARDCDRLAPIFLNPRLLRTPELTTSAELVLDAIEHVTYDVLGDSEVDDAAIDAVRQAAQAKISKVVLFAAATRKRQALALLKRSTLLSLPAFTKNVVSMIVRRISLKSKMYP